jgi:hypothetical protein
VAINSKRIGLGKKGYFFECYLPIRSSCVCVSADMDSVTDPSDWGGSDDCSCHSGLRDLDVLLRCPICHDFLDGAVMAPDCSHTCKKEEDVAQHGLKMFAMLDCSLCIRRYLLLEQICPICRKVNREHAEAESFIPHACFFNRMSLNPGC